MPKKERRKHRGSLKRKLDRRKVNRNTNAVPAWKRDRPERAGPTRRKKIRENRVPAPSRRKTRGATTAKNRKNGGRTRSGIGRAPVEAGGVQVGIRQVLINPGGARAGAKVVPAPAAPDRVLGERASPGTGPVSPGTKGAPAEVSIS